MTIIEKAKLLESYGNVVEKIKELDAQEKEIIESIG